MGVCAKGTEAWMVSRLPPPSPSLPPHSSPSFPLPSSQKLTLFTGRHSALHSIQGR